MSIEARVPGDQLEQFKGRLTVMKLIHLALVAGVVIFGSVVFFIIPGKMSFVPAYQNPVVLVAAALVAVGGRTSSRAEFIIGLGFGARSPVHCISNTLPRWCTLS